MKCLCCCDVFVVPRIAVCALVLHDCHAQGDSMQTTDSKVFEGLFYAIKEAADGRGWQIMLKLAKESDAKSENSDTRERLHYVCISHKNVQSIAAKEINLADYDGAPSYNSCVNEDFSAMNGNRCDERALYSYRSARLHSKKLYTSC
jgi:hypothetical protein